MQNECNDSIPEWLIAPPDQTLAPPVHTKLQDLPFDKLTWKNFERLCLRLVQEEAAVEHCQQYGERGDNQEGIDIYAKMKDEQKYTVYQCKREKNYGSVKIKKAVSKFIQGEWMQQASSFVLCTQESLKKRERADTFKEQREILQKKGVNFIAWDSNFLSGQLKKHCDIVGNFFGRPWVEAFCVDVQIDNLSEEAEKDTLARRYQLWLSEKTSYFIIPTLSKTLSLSDCYRPRKVNNCCGDKQAFNAELIPKLYKKCILIGNSAIGKSTLIKRLANNLINDNQKVLLIRLPEVLRLYQKGETFEGSVLDCSVDGLDANKTLFKLIFKEPDYLLVDECTTTHQADIVDKLVSWANGHLLTKIIITSRSGNIPERLSDWPQLVLQSLNAKDTQNLLSNALENIVDSNSGFQDKLAITENIFQNKRLLSMATANPLLAGFIIRLAISDIDITQKSQTEIYKAVIKHAYDHLPEFRDPIELDKRSAQKVLEIIGWNLIQNDYLTEDELIDKGTSINSNLLTIWSHY